MHKSSKMAGRILPFLLALLACSRATDASAFQDVCPCSDEKLCKPVSVSYRKEVLGFMIRTDNWRGYNWSEMTTLAIFTTFDDQELRELMCFAHSKKVRLVLNSGQFNLSDLGNVSARAAWISDLLSQTLRFFLDGVNIDIESPIDDDSTEPALLTQLVKETYYTFKAMNPNYQVTYDVAWSPDCIDGRCYEYAKLANYTDFLVIMSYDERSQIKDGPCIASANSANITTFYGIQEYLQLGIPNEKLVLGLPWYGYDYPCLSLFPDNVCMIKKVPFRGVSCSDAAGRQRGYRDIIENILPVSTSGRLYNLTLDSPYMNYKASDGTMHQIWYDDPQSLADKYLYAASQGMRGLAFWNIDCLDYAGNDTAHKAQTKEMWDTISVFLNH